MDFVRLTPEQRRTFDEDGLLVVPGALPREHVEQLVESGDHLAEAFLKKPPVPGKSEYNHLDLRPGLLREQPLFDLVANATTVSLVVQLLGPNIHLHSTALIYKRPADPNAPPFRRGWHRDIRMPKDVGYQQLPRVGVKICYCLTDFPQSNSGMTLFARKSHLRTSPLAIAKGEVDPRDVELTDPVVKAGDAILFENRLFHTAAPNRSDRTSRVLMYGYSYRWMKPEVYLETPEAALLRKGDPITRQLLGGYRDVDTPPWALDEWATRNGVQPEPVPWTVEI